MRVPLGMRLLVSVAGMCAAVALAAAPPALAATTTIPPYAPDHITNLDVITGVHLIKVNMPKGAKSYGFSTLNGSAMPTSRSTTWPTKYQKKDTARLSYCYAHDAGNGDSWYQSAFTAQNGVYTVVVWFTNSNCEESTYSDYQPDGRLYNVYSGGVFASRAIKGEPDNLNNAWFKP